ncbi:hypothetical protein V8C42DRAFT_338230 [Trichoderma barbatum]
MSDDDCMNECFTDNEITSQLCNIPTSARRRSPSLSSQGCNKWNPNRLQYDKQRYIHYELEWKLTVNNRQVAKQTEQDLVLAPGDFWNKTLMSRLDELVRKTQVNKQCAADATTIVMSVTKRSERNVTKRFDEIKVDWQVVERQLQTWSHLTHNGRKLIIKVTFNYKETKTAGPAGQGSTIGQLTERQARRDAERAVLGRTAAWEHVFAIFSCPGPPCDRGPYCWQDPTSRKHFKLMGHQLRNLVKQVQRGEDINRHEDMPREIRDELYAEEQQQSSRKRKRANSGSYATGLPAIHIHNIIPGQPDTTLTTSRVTSTPETVSLRCALEGLGMRDDVAEDYFAWYSSPVRRQALKEEYDRACELALGKGLDLELIHDDQDGVYSTNS